MFMKNSLKKVPLRQDRLSDQVKHHLKAGIPEFIFEYNTVSGPEQ